MIEYIKKIFNDFLNSFKGDDEGYSFKKITAAILIVMIIGIHGKWAYLGDLDDLEAILIIDYSFISSLLGMATYQNLQKYKGSSNGEKKDPDSGS